MNDEVLDEHAAMDQASGLHAGPFSDDPLDYLLEESKPVNQALESLANKCWYTDEVLLVTLEAPALQEALGSLLDQRLGEDFQLASLEADMLAGPAELLRRLGAALGLDARLLERGGEAELLEAIDAAIDRAYSDSREVVVQIRNAHELNRDAAEVLLPLVEKVDERVAPHLLLWGDLSLADAMEGLLDDRGVAFSHVPIPAFSRDEIRDWLSWSLREAGYAGDFPFSDAQLDRLWRRAAEEPLEINRLASEALSGADKAGGGRDRRRAGGSGFPLPLLHSLAGLGLLAVLALLYIGSGGEDVSVEAVAPPPAALTPPQRGTAGPVESAEAVPQPQASRPGLAAEAPPRESAESESRPNAEILAAAPAAAEARSPAPEVSAPVQKDPPPPAEESTPAGPPAPASLSQLERHHQALLAMPPDAYLIQLFGSFSEESARAFAETVAESSDGNTRFRYFETRHQGRPWFVVVFGAFEDRARATQALAALPEEATGGGPWIRRVSEITAQID